MSEEQAPYELSDRAVISEARESIHEISKHYAMIPDDLVRSGKLGAIAVYAALDRIAKDNKTQADVAISFLAVYCDLSTSTVQKAIAWLVDQQYIRVIHVGPGRQSNRYILPFRESRLNLDGRNTPITSAENTNDISVICQQSNRSQERGQETPSVPSDFFQKSSVTAGGTTPGKKEVDEIFRERMRVKYGGILTDIDDRIDECLAHPATQKHKDMQLTVQGWLRRDSEKLTPRTSSTPASRVMSSTAPTASGKKQFEYALDAEPIGPHDLIGHRGKSFDIPYSYTEEGKKEIEECRAIKEQKDKEKEARNVAAGRKFWEDER